MINVCQLKKCQRRERLVYQINDKLPAVGICALFLFVAGVESIVDIIFNLF